MIANFILIESGELAVLFAQFCAQLGGCHKIPFQTSLEVVKSVPFRGLSGKTLLRGDSQEAGTSSQFPENAKRTIFVTLHLTEVKWRYFPLTFGMSHSKNIVQFRKMFVTVKFLFGHKQSSQMCVLWLKKIKIFEETFLGTPNRQLVRERVRFQGWSWSICPVKFEEE